MIIILPFLLITLHFSQIGFTDDLTFILNLLSAIMNNNDLPVKKDRLIFYHPEEQISTVSLNRQLFICPSRLSFPLKDHRETSQELPYLPEVSG